MVSHRWRQVCLILNPDTVLILSCPTFHWSCVYDNYQWHYLFFRELLSPRKIYLLPWKPVKSSTHNEVRLELNLKTKILNRWTDSKSKCVEEITAFIMWHNYMGKMVCGRHRLNISLLLSSPLTLLSRSFAQTSTFLPLKQFSSISEFHRFIFEHAKRITMNWKWLRAAKVTLGFWFIAAVLFTCLTVCQSFSPT